MKQIVSFFYRGEKNQEFHVPLDIQNLYATLTKTTVLGEVLIWINHLVFWKGHLVMDTFPGSLYKYAVLFSLDEC